MKLIPLSSYTIRGIITLGRLSAMQSDTELHSAG